MTIVAVIALALAVIAAVTWDLGRRFLTFAITDNAKARALAEATRAQVRDDALSARMTKAETAIEALKAENRAASVGKVFGNR